MQSSSCQCTHGRSWKVDDVFSFSASRSRDSEGEEGEGNARTQTNERSCVNVSS
jgi:hypothetical protein